VSELNVNTAKNILELARENAGDKSPILTALKQDVASAKTKYGLDSTNYYRYSNLSKENAVSQAALDQSRTQFEISKQTYVKAVNNLESTRDRLRVELQNAENQYQAQLLNKNDFTLFSAIRGKVYDILPDEGALVSPGMPLVEVGDGNQFYVEMSVDEMDIALIKKGQEIVFEIDAFREKIFNGKVTEVFLRVNPANKISRVLASIEAAEPAAFHSGMSVEANIIVSQKKNALVIPREFIKDGNKVKLASSGEMKEIKKGVEDLLYIEVLEGLEESSEIQKP
jgi:multidrug resistance efflux pump